MESMNNTEREPRQIEMCFHWLSHIAFRIWNTLRFYVAGTFESRGTGTKWFLRTSTIEWLEIYVIIRDSRVTIYWILFSLVVAYLLYEIKYSNIL